MATIEERKLLRYRRVVVPTNRVEWYRSLFEEGGLFRPRRSLADAEVLSDRGRRTVVRFLERNGADPHSLPMGHAPGGAAVKTPALTAGVVLKEEKYPFPTCLHGFLTVPRAEREFYNLQALRSLGFPAVEPLAFGHSGFGILYHRSFLMTREFTGAANLKSWSHGKPGAFSREDIERALLSFARELARLHRARCYIRTLYGKNILVRRANENGVELAVCDVPRLWWFRGKALSFHLATRDLACLDKWARRVFSSRGRLAFLKAYLEKLGEGPPLRQWVRKILRHGERLHHRTLLGWTSKKIRKTLKRWHLDPYWPF